MSLRLRTLGLAALAFVLALAVLPDLFPRPAPSHPASITTDTAAYCKRLVDRVDALALAAPPPVPSEALQLRAEGQQRCIRGQVRSGLICLRRAVVLLRRSRPSGP